MGSNCQPSREGECRRKAAFLVQYRLYPKAVPARGGAFWCSMQTPHIKPPSLREVDFAKQKTEGVNGFHRARKRATLSAHTCLCTAYRQDSSRRAGRLSACRPRGHIRPLHPCGLCARPRVSPRQSPFRAATGPHAGRLCLSACHRTLAHGLQPCPQQRLRFSACL